MSKLREIIDGHVNEFLDIVGLEDEKKNEVFTSRQNICITCPLKFGNTCNKSKFINPITLEVVDKPTSGFIRGCGCRLSAKQKSPSSRCPAGFWGGEFNKN